MLTTLLELTATWLAPGFASDAKRLELTVTLVRIMLPFVLFAALAQLVGGMLNELGRFAAAAALPTLFNAVVIATLPLLGGAPGDARARPRLGRGGGRRGAARLRLARLTPGRIPAPTGAAAPGSAEQAVMLVDLALASLPAAGAVSWLHCAERVARLLPSLALPPAAGLAAFVLAA